MSFPDMSEVLDDFSEPIHFAKICKTVEDYEAVDTVKEVVGFDGVLQPIPPQKLKVKPEGQRSWKWYTLWTENILKLDDVVQDDDGLQYRVMSVSDWSKGGYTQYELTQGPTIEE